MNAEGSSVTVIGANGFVGRRLVEDSLERGRRVLAATADGFRGPECDRLRSILLPDAAALDEHYDEMAGGQIVMLPQLQRPVADWLIDRVDGPRWVVFSSAQLAGATTSPGHAVALARERLALERGALVVRPTMIFGRAGDVNITRVARLLASTRVPFHLGSGLQLVQPVHVDDVADLVARAGHEPRSGRYDVGGADRVTSLELITMLSELLGVRTPVLRVPQQVIGLARVAAPMFGIRPDQIERLLEDKVVDIAPAIADFGWQPAPLAHRLEQAVAEAGLGAAVGGR